MKIAQLIEIVVNQPEHLNKSLEFDPVRYKNSKHDIFCLPITRKKLLKQNTLIHYLVCLFFTLFFRWEWGEVDRKDRHLLSLQY